MRSPTRFARSISNQFVTANVARSIQAGFPRPYRRCLPQLISPPTRLHSTSKIPITVLGEEVKGPKKSDPKLLFGYTCGKCNSRQYKLISSHAYHNTVVLAKCAKCANVHLVADHLGWFRDESVTVETLMKEKGEEVRNTVRPGELKDVEALLNESAEKSQEAVQEGEEATTEEKSPAQGMVGTTELEREQQISTADGEESSMNESAVQ